MTGERNRKVFFIWTSGRLSARFHEVRRWLRRQQRFSFIFMMMYYQSLMKSVSFSLPKPAHPDVACPQPRKPLSGLVEAGTIARRVSIQSTMGRLP
jgi:hypothetical protein